MPKIYRIFFFVVIVLLTKTTSAQIGKDTIPTSVNVELENIFNSKTPKEYTIAAIKVTGTQSFDANLIVSISGLAVGDKVMIPGTDAFSKAINNLWKQNLISNVEIYFTRLIGKNLDVEISITERARLSSFKFVGIKKGESDDLNSKVGLVKGRVVTENMKLSAVENIKKFFVEKGFRNTDVQVVEKRDTSITNSVLLTFIIDKKNKVKVNEIIFGGNDNVSDTKLKKQMKGTKEMSRLTLHPAKVINPYSDADNSLSFKDYLKQNGYLSPSKTKEFLDPYVRFKLASAKFNDKKYAEDKNKVLDYYNSLGYRDAVILKDTPITDNKGNLSLAIKLSEGHKYVFGNITWRGNTKYSDSLLSVFLGIQKGETYNAETLNKRLGKQASQEGGDISSLYMDDGYLF
ncbi:MAG: POTRA domain-containing protein, partial [Ginsengibacter sp.]